MMDFVYSVDTYRYELRCWCVVSIILLVLVTATATGPRKYQLCLLSDRESLINFMYIFADIRTPSLADH